MPGIDVKNLFVKDKHNNYGLVSMDLHKRADLKKIAKEFGYDRLSFCNPDELMQYLAITPGSVTPLCIQADKENKVKVLFDENFEGQKVIVHPLRNTASISIEFKDLCRFVEHFNHSWKLADVYKEEYKFYGWQTADCKPADSTFAKVKNPCELYDLLSKIWCAETCAPRMRENWTRENQTLGQCSITAFLAQDIFGGKVYGILRSGGNYHCYNVVGDCVFDLTSEQFGDEKLCYENNPEQSREVHFAKEEKRLRYEYLKSELLKLLEK